MIKQPAKIINRRLTLYFMLSMAPIMLDVFMAMLLTVEIHTVVAYLMSMLSCSRK
jgi:hypothetical protein